MRLRCRRELGVGRAARAVAGGAGLVALLAAGLAASTLANRATAAVPPLPTGTLPSVSVPTTVATTVPTVTVPTVSVPTVTVPTVSTPTATTPTVSTPTVSTPTVTATTVTVPAATVATTTTPTATVSTPSVPSSTVAAPPPPRTSTPTAPTAPTAPTSPTVPTSATASPGASARAQGTSGSSAPGAHTTGAAGATAGSSSWTPGPSWGVPAAGSRATAARPAPLRFRPARPGSRTPARLVVVAERPGPILLVYRGPAPSCEVAGRVRVNGRAGRNALRLNGRVKGGRLKPGIFRLDAYAIRPDGRFRLGHLVIALRYRGDAKRAVVRRVKDASLRCAGVAQALGYRFVAGESAGGGPFAGSPKVGTPPAIAPEAAAPPLDQQIGDVAGERKESNALDRIARLPLLDGGSILEDLGWFGLGIALGLGFLLLPFLLFVFVARVARS